MQTTEQQYDVIIVGGGPAGLSAAIYSARARLKTLVVDKNPAAGALGSTGKVENYPALEGAVTGPELLDRFREQAKAFGARFEKAEVLGIAAGGETKSVFTTDKTYEARVLIIATGSMGRKATIPGEERLTGSGVSYCAACDAPFFKGKDVAVIGAPAAIEDELDAIARFAHKVYLISRGEVSEEMEKALSTKQNLVRLPHRGISEILGETHVTGIKAAQEGGGTEEIPVDGVFLFLQGNRPVVGFLQDQLELTASGCVKVGNDMTTSVEGVFAVGDVTCRGTRQAVIAASEGCVAALEADKYINKRNRIRPQWK